MAKPRVMLGAESLQRRASGIARVARLVARVLAEEAFAGRIEASALALNDPAPAADLGIPVRTMRGSRARFAYELHRAALNHTHFIYDFAGMARAHPKAWPLARRHLVWVHGIEIWEDARADRLRCARRADVLVANSAYTRKRMAALHAELAHAQPCWLATEEDQRPNPADLAGPPRVLILSRLDEDGGYKGHRELIASWPQVIAAVPQARLLVAGDGPGMPLIREWSQRSPARDAIELLGFVPQSAVDTTWRRATVFAMPSRGEGFGLAYAEAMRHGLPVIASAHDAGAEINVDGVTGCNVDLDQPNALRDTLVRLLSDRTECERMGAAGHARWSEHFTYSGFRSRFLPLLDRLIRS